MSANGTLALYRRVLRELKRSHPAVSTAGGAAWQYITSQVRYHGNNDNEDCVGSQLQLLETYFSYLESSRIHTELLSLYQGRGERSVEETARLVGLKVPDSTNNLSNNPR